MEIMERKEFQGPRVMQEIKCRLGSRGGMYGSWTEKMRGFVHEIRTNKLDREGGTKSDCSES